MRRTEHIAGVSITGIHTSFQSINSRREITVKNWALVTLYQRNLKKKNGSGGIQWIKLAQDTAQWRALAKTIIIHGVP
jgi:hypothetical protein